LNVPNVIELARRHGEGHGFVLGQVHPTGVADLADEIAPSLETLRLHALLAEQGSGTPETGEKAGRAFSRTIELAPRDMRTAIHPVNDYAFIVLQFH